MSEQTDRLISMLLPMGLSEEEARVYLELLRNGSMTALQLSRHLSMGRTKVYRILDKLMGKELAINQFDEVGFKFVATDPTKFDQLLTRRMGEISALKQTMPQLKQLLEGERFQADEASKVLYYRGESGLIQVNYNLLRARKEFCSFEIAQAETYIPHEEAEELRRQLVTARIKTRTLTNQRQIESFTKVDGVTRFWEIRHIDPVVFRIQADVFIYNDVYALCQYAAKRDVFCVEIYNPLVAEMQRQLFEYLWAQARPLVIVNEQGEAKLLNV